MSNGVPKPNEFDAATRVMESDLLQKLTDKSSSAGDKRDADRAREATPPIEVVDAQSIGNNVATANAPDGDAEDVAPTSECPSLTTGNGQSNVAPERRARGSRVFIIAGIVAAVVIAFDVSLFVFHPRRAPRPAAPPAAAPEPMPRYMIVPLSSPSPATGAATAQPAVVPPETPTPVVASATAEAQATATTHEHRHSHHRHGSH